MNKLVTEEVRNYMAAMGRKGGSSGKGTAWRREVCRHAAVVRWRAVREAERLEAEKLEAQAIKDRDEADREFEMATAEREAMVAMIPQGDSGGGESVADPAATQECGVTTCSPTTDPLPDTEPIILEQGVVLTDSPLPDETIQKMNEPSLTEEEQARLRHLA